MKRKELKIGEEYGVHASNDYGYGFLFGWSRFRVIDLDGLFTPRYSWKTPRTGITVVRLDPTTGKEMLVFEDPETGEFVPRFEVIRAQTIRMTWAEKSERLAAVLEREDRSRFSKKKQTAAWRESGLDEAMADLGLLHRNYGGGGDSSDLEKETIEVRLTRDQCSALLRGSKQ